MALIDSERLKKEIAEHSYIMTDEWNNMGYAMFSDGCGQIIDEQPEVDAKPVVHAHWEEQDEGWDTYHSCSACGYELSTLDGASPESNGICFCPHCGAKMDEGAGNE